jgi:cbb3-type cytochrome oxidase maturation protein
LLNNENTIFLYRNTLIHFMSVIFLLIGIGIIVAGGFLVAFIWSVKSGQYDDDYTPSIRILFDDMDVTPASNDQSSPEKKDSKNKQQPNNK